MQTLKAPDRAVFTIATGDRIYLEMAFALARSYRMWRVPSDPVFYLVTDAGSANIPADLADLRIIPIKSGEYGLAFTPKLHLDKFAPAPCSLFIDADCLCVGSLGPAFEDFAGRAVSVIGRRIGEGQWFGDVGALCRQFGVPSVPRFNGGVYYLEAGSKCTEVYDEARRLLPLYDEIGFGRLRGSPNDEVLMSLAMALHGQEPIPERGDIMNSLLAGPAGLEIDVFKSRALLHNPRGHPRHNDWYDLEVSRPRIVHFLGMSPSAYPYAREIDRLRLVDEKRWPVWLATACVVLTHSLPWLAKQRFKDLFRPLFHAMVGPRKARAGR